MAIEYMKVAFENQLCHWVVTAMQSFAMAQHDQFMKPLSLANPVQRVPSRQTISRRLKTM